ncbi:MAG: alpha/beta hydrolase family protein [Stenotrophobium sp.]
MQAIRTKLVVITITIAVAALLTACGHHSGPVTAVAGMAQIPPDAPGHTNNVPPSPEPGQSRAGLTYSIYIKVPATGDTFAFTVFEPGTLEGGKKYPLLLYGHGGGDQRITNKNDPQSANSPFNDNVGFFIDHGYGVISMDQRGHGESSGTIRLMDPDYEGLDLLALLDWAEAKLDWLAYGPSVDGSDPHNLMLGAIGASYGGGFQMLIQDIDPKHRLDAIVPEATWNDLRYSIYPNEVLKTLIGTFLLGRLTVASNGQAINHLDPYAQSIFTDGLMKNRLDPDQLDFLYYHSNAYFCGDQSVATNGGPGTAPLFPPRHPGKINAMFWQGMRDPLFNFNEAYQNYLCYKQAGGDVRLLTYQVGHNTTPVVPDPGELAFQPPGDFETNNRCGGINVHDAALAFFDEHLKGIAGAADKVPKQVCLSLSGADTVLVDQVTTGHQGVQKDIPATNVIAGVTDVPIAVNLGIAAGVKGDVIGGLPRLEVDIEPLISGAPGEPIIFAGIGQMHASAPGIWDLVDNQYTPLRGTGPHVLDMAGITQRLQPGDQLALLLYGGSDQYPISGSINLAQPTVMPVTVTGKIWVPLLGPLPTAP